MEHIILWIELINKEIQGGGGGCYFLDSLQTGIHPVLTHFSILN